MISSAEFHPIRAINCWPTGAMTNWPKEPPAVASPKAMLRFSGATTRPTAPSTTAKVVPDRAKPIR